MEDIVDSEDLKKKVKQWIKEQEQQKADKTQRLNKFEVLRKELEGGEI